jgi:hypothetical protein
MSPEDLRVEFARVLTLKPDQAAASAKLEAEMLAAQLAAVRAKYPGKRINDFKTANKLDPELVKSVRDPFERRAAEWQQRAAGLKLRRDAMLDELAVQLTPIVTPDRWSRVRTFFASSYASQGFGATTYARQRAELEAIEIRAQGLPVRLIEESRQSMGTEVGRLRWVDVHFEVEGEVLDYEIARRRPGLSLVEWVQKSWDQGVNPRVMMPGLDPLFEGRHGIDMCRPRRR